MKIQTKSILNIFYLHIYFQFDYDKHFQWSVHIYVGQDVQKGERKIGGGVIMSGSL